MGFFQFLSESQELCFVDTDKLILKLAQEGANFVLLRLKWEGSQFITSKPAVRTGKGSVVEDPPFS